MALPDTLVARLIETVKTHGLSGRFAMLGRQTWVGSRRGASAKLLSKVLEEHLPGVTEDQLHNVDDAYSEALFHQLGFSQVDSIDYSDFEKASIFCDLSQKLPKELEAQFDVIYDGGTCEHIFDLPTAYKNIDKALNPGGGLIGQSPCNNWINHGFCQICPEMIFGYWQNARGYEVLDVLLQPLRPALANQTARVSDPTQTGRRPRVQGELPTGAPLIIHYVVRKPLTPKRAKRAYQTDYVQRWNG